MLNTQVDVQSEVLTEYVSTSVTEAAEVGSIHISSASATYQATVMHAQNAILCKLAYITQYRYRYTRIQ